MAHPAGSVPRAGLRLRNISTGVHYFHIRPISGACFPSGRRAPASMPPAIEHPGTLRLQRITTTNSSTATTWSSRASQTQQLRPRTVPRAAAAAAGSGDPTTPPGPAAVPSPAAGPTWNLATHGVVSVRQQAQSSSSSSSSTSAAGPPPWQQWTARMGQMIQYRLMLLFRLPTWGKVLSLVLLGLPIVVMGSCLLKGVTDLAWGEAAQLTFYVLQNVPGADITCFSEFSARLVLVTIHMLSLYTFATLVGLLTEDVRSTVDNIRCGNFPIPSRDHTVILDGGGDANRVIGVLQKVLETREALGGGVYGGDIAILSTHPKDELDKMIADVLPKQSGRVVTRNGNPIKLSDLERVAAVHARTVLLLAPDGPMGHVGPELQQQLCLTALRSLHPTTASTSTTTTSQKKRINNHNNHQQQRRQQQQQQQRQQQRQQRRQPQRVVVETTGAGLSSSAVAAGGMETEEDPLRVTHVSSTSSAYRVAVQCAVQPGLAAVFDAVFCRADDASIRLIDLPPGMAGRTFAEARRSFRRAVVCGLLPGAHSGTRGGGGGGGGGGSGPILLSPPDGQLLGGSDRLVLLAAGPEDCVWEAGELQMDPEPVLTSRYDAARSKPSRLVLLAADSRLAEQMLEALEEFAAEGCNVTVVSPESCDGLPSGPTQRAQLLVSNVVGDPLSLEVLTAADVAAADAVILTGTDDLTADDADAMAVGTALLLQQLMATDPRVTDEQSEALADAAAAAAPPPLPRPLTFVCSLQDPQNRSVLQHIGVDACRTATRTAALTAGGAIPSRGLGIEVIEPEALISGMLAQVGAEPLLVTALEDLLDESGCEIYIKRCDRYGMAPGSRVSWAQITEVVRKEDDVALGFLHQGLLHLAPPADEVLEVAAGDKLVVLSEEFL